MRKLLMVGIVFTTCLFLNGNASAAPAQLESGDAVSLQETALAGTPTGVAAVELFLDPGFPDVGYANVVIDLDGDGLEPSTDDWWVQNFALVLEPAPGTQDNLAFAFDLEGLSPVGDFDVYASFTSSPVDPPSPASMVLTPDVPFGLYDIGDLQEAAADGLLAGIGPAAESMSFPVDARDSPIAPGVDNALLGQEIIGRTRRDIPGIKQGPNECAPTSAAQSLLWLKKRYGNLEGLPAQAELIDRLKRAMSPGWTSGKYPGIWPSDFVPGKNTVVNDLKLKIITKSGGADDGTGTFEFIKHEIEAGEDVELVLDYHRCMRCLQDGNGDTSVDIDAGENCKVDTDCDALVSGDQEGGCGAVGPLCKVDADCDAGTSACEPNGGHVVTVAGWYDDGTKKELCFKDPLPGGTAVDCYTIEGTTIKDYLYGNGARTTMSFAVSESIISVGGSVELLVDGPDAPASAAAGSGSSAPPYAALTGGIAAAAVALTAGAWYARRRWLS